MRKKQTVIKKIKVKNELGLHTRPATLIVKLLHDCNSEVFFTYKKQTVDAKSILNILMLAVHKNALITIKIIGLDAPMTMDRLVNSFETCFCEDLSNDQK